MSVEISAKIPAGADRTIRRIVEENCRTLRFRAHWFEVEQGRPRPLSLGDTLVCEGRPRLRGTPSSARMPAGGSRALPNVRACVLGFESYPPEHVFGGVPARAVQYEPCKTPGCMR